MRQSIQMPSEIPPEQNNESFSRKEFNPEVSISTETKIGIDQYFENFSKEEITPRKQEAYDVLKELIAMDDRRIASLRDTAQSSQVPMADRLHALDILELSANICRKFGTDMPRLQQLVQSYVYAATHLNDDDNIIITGALADLSMVNRLETDPVIHNPGLASPVARRRTPVDVVVKRSEDPTEDERLYFFEIEGTAGGASKKFNVSNQKQKTKELLGEYTETFYSGDDRTQSRHAHQEQLSKESETVDILEGEGVYVSVGEYREFQTLIHEPGVDITPEEYEAIVQSQFMGWSKMSLDVDWSALTLREQVYAFSYLKSVPANSEEGALVLDFLRKHKELGVASFQISAGGFKNFVPMMRVLLLENDGFSKEILSVFRTISNAADQVDALLGGTRPTGEPILSEEEIRSLRKKMLTRGVQLLNRYISQFEYADADEENLTSEQLLERLPVHFGGKAQTPFLVAREMRQEIANIRADAELYAEFIKQEYAEDPSTIQDVLRTDFRTLSIEEIAEHEEEFVRVLEQNRKKFITDEQELANRILEFREQLHTIQTDPDCPVQVQMFSFKDNLIGFNTIEHIGDPSEKRVKIESFSMEPDVQHPVVGHAHIKKIMFEMYNDYTIEGEVHPNNKRLLNTYVKQYGFEITGTAEKKGTTFTLIRRLPDGAQSDLETT